MIRKMGVHEQFSTLRRRRRRRRRRRQLFIESKNCSRVIAARR